jgi:hypothetical protein
MNSQGVLLPQSINEDLRNIGQSDGGFSLWARTDDSPQEEKPKTYFLNSLPENLLVEQVHQR